MSIIDDQSIIAESLFLFISIDKLALVHKDTENYQAWKIIVRSNP